MNRFFVVSLVRKFVFLFSFAIFFVNPLFIFAEEGLLSEADLLFCSSPGISLDIPANYISVKSGRWADPETWGKEDGTFPGADDFVVIRSKVQVEGHPVVAGLQIDSSGQLWGNDTRLSITTSGSVLNNGTIETISIKLSGGSGAVVNNGLWSQLRYEDSNYTFDGSREITSFSGSGGSIAGCPVFGNFGGNDISIPKGSAVTASSTSGVRLFGDGKLIIIGDSGSISGDLSKVIFSGSGQRLSLPTLQAQEVYFIGGSKQVATHGNDFTGEPWQADRFLIYPGSSLSNPSSGGFTAWHLYIRGDIENYGSIGNTNIHSIGSLKNNGEWSGGTLAITGTAPRYITGSSPIMTSVTISESFPLLNSHVVFGGNFGIASGKSILFAPDDTFLTDPENDIDTYIAEFLGPVSGNIIAEMADGKAMDPQDSTEILLSKSDGEQNVQSDLTADTIRFSGGTKRFYRQTFTGDLIIEPDAALVNWKEVWSELTHYGDIINKGSVIGKDRGNSFYMNIYGSIENSGTWRDTEIRLKGNEKRKVDGIFDSNVNIDTQGFEITGNPVFSRGFSMGSNPLVLGKNEDGTDTLLFLNGANVYGNLHMIGADESIEATVVFAGHGQAFDHSIRADRVIFTKPLESTSTVKTIYRPTFFGDIFVDEGVILEDYGDSWGKIIVNGDVHNNGTIRSRVSGGNKYWRQLSVEISGDIFTGENGGWSSDSIDLFWNDRQSGNYEYSFTADAEKASSVSPDQWEETRQTTGTSYNAKQKVQSGTPWYWAWRKKLGTDEQGNTLWSDWERHTINVAEETNTPPQLTLLGEEVITLSEGDEFTDSGVTATDTEDGDITDQVTVTYEYAPNAEAEKVPADGIDTSLVGEFTITYSVTDSGGLSAQAVRTVSILPAPKLTFSEEPDFNGVRGVNRVKATANEDPITFKVVYTDGTEPSGVKVEAVVTEEIDFQTTAFEERLGFNNDLSCVPERIEIEQKGGLLGCFMTIENNRGFMDDEIEIILPEKKESVSIKIYPEENTNMTLEVVGYNVAGIPLATEEVLVDSIYGLTNVSVSSVNGDIHSVKLRTKYYNSGKIYFQKISISEALVMNPEHEIDDINFAVGETYHYHKHFPKGKYHYQFRANNGKTPITRPEEPLSFETGYSNVVFLPGLQASRLYQGDSQLWEPVGNGDALRLRMKSDSSGQSEFSDIYTKDAIDEGLGILNIYLSFLNDLEDWEKNGVINQKVVIPYDWRYDFDWLLKSGERVGDEIYFSSFTSNPYILEKIEEAIDSSANGKITIVTHSNGGLLAKYMFAELQEQTDEQSKKIVKNTENLIMVAPPQLGTPKAIGSLLNGYGQEILKTLLLDERSARKASEFMPGAFNLLPSAQYFEWVKDIAETDDISFLEDTTVVEFDPSLGEFGTEEGEIQFNFNSVYGPDIDSLAELQEFMRGDEGRGVPEHDILALYPIKLSDTLLKNAEDIHAKIDYWQPSLETDMKVVQIAGWGLDTVKAVRYTAKCTPGYGDFCSPENMRLKIDPVLTFDGDETVVVPSAIAMRDVPGVETYYVDIEKYNEEEVDRKHASILEIDDIRNFISASVQHDPIDVREDQRDTEYDTMRFPYTLKTQPIKTDSYIRLALHSPVSIDIYDANGSRTGATYDLENADEIIEIVEQIPNSYFMEFGEGKYLGIPADQEYRIELKGLDHGTFTFEMEEVIGDEVIHSKLFEDIPTSPSMKAEMTVETLEESTPLKIDADGDGEQDTSLTGEEGDEAQTISASMIILQKMIEQMDIKGHLKKQLIHSLDQVMKFLEKENTKQAVNEIERMIKHIELELKKDERLLQIRDGYIERITQQKQQLEKTLRERLAKYFGSKWEEYWKKYEENFEKRIEAIKNRYKSTISQEDADIIIYLLNNVKRMIEK